jgi:HD-GYP domain-containing protein (c-di-GMP phosphodiesterase class II)
MGTHKPELSRRTAGVRRWHAVPADDGRLVEQSREGMMLAPTPREVRATVAVAAVFALAVAAIAAWAPDRGGHSVVTAGLLVLCYALVARVQFEAGSGVAVPTQLVFIPMLFLAAPAAVPVLVALGFALSTLPEDLRGRHHPGRLGLHIVSASYAVGPVLVLWLAGDPRAALDLKTVALVLTMLVAQSAFDFAGWVALGYSPWNQARALLAAWRVDLVLTPLGLALADAGSGHLYAVMLGLPLVWLLGDFAREHTARIDQKEELSKAYRGTALLLGDVVEADDAYTGRHSHDVVSLVLAVSDRMGLDANSRRDAELTALLHDVGKVTIPKSIIQKPGPLTAEERSLIEQHTLEGERMLDQVGGLLADVGRLVRSCHEHWDGRGYPDGLVGEEIPLVARIVCACDAWSAMTTDRCYRTALPHEAALAELRRCAGTQFDPRVVAVLIDVVGARTGPALIAAA